jgi:acyl carrier protein
MLPDPLVAGLSAGNEYEAPRNETEEKLARIWKTLLGKDRIGVKDNFFELGGHSLQATQLIARIKKEFSVRINIQTLFNEPTIENISDHILFLLDQEQRMRNSEQLMEIDLL